MKPNYTEFFDFAKEREAIRVQKANHARLPWTKDKVLQEFRFCNVFREDDKTTKWFRGEIRSPLRNDPSVLFATVAFRWFNRISTGRALLPWLTMEKEWNEDEVLWALNDIVREGRPIVTGAYVIKTPNGAPKSEGIVECLRRFRKLHEKQILEVASADDATLEKVHERLMYVPYLGSFMAYEIVTDLRHTYLLRDAPDIMTWAAAGPGAARGLGWLYNGAPAGYNYQSTKGQSECLWRMRQVLAESAIQWPMDRIWEMREVEHTLCEYDKWKRGHDGDHLKRKYRP